MVVAPQSPSVSLLKVGLFGQRYICSARGDFGASFYDKISTSTFFGKNVFLSGSDP